MAIPRTMKALKISKPTPAEQAHLVEIPVPQVKPGWVLVQVQAFGLNNSERLVRLEEIGNPWIAPSVVPGIECAGVVADPSDSRFSAGQKVVACMGGMGREFDGSYAEYALLPESRVFAVPASINWDWATLGSFPETYLTAWGSLFECLQLKAGESLLIRGATCGLGYAAIQLAQALNCEIIATARNKRGLATLEEVGVNKAILDKEKLAGSISANKVLDLIGAAAIFDTLRLAEPGGIVCSTGILGGKESIDGFDPIKDIPNGVYLTGYFSNYPTQETFDAMFGFMKQHNLTPLVKACFNLEDIRLALLLQEAGAGGKIVVRVNR
jgi:NADPH:quinone reductase-like Zn-dependent oxidoreductase